MANEWTIVNRTEHPLDYTISDATGIEKGALLALTDSGTAILASASAQVCAGVAAREKVADDGRTQLAVYKKGRFVATASGAIAIGNPIVAGLTGSLNFVSAGLGAAHSGAAILGYAEGTAATDEPIQVRLDL